MITPNPLAGVGLHALGGICASGCYLPFHRTKNWSWVSFWLVQAFFAWILVPLILGIATVPDFFSVLAAAPPGVALGAFLLGGLYGFGGMSFGLATRSIGYSLTYTISIGISAVLGTLIPLMLEGNLVEYFAAPGGDLIALAMGVSLLGLSLCGWAGFRKEKEAGEAAGFNMRKGLVLTILAGLLSAVFNISLEFGQPIADLAAQNGAGQFEGNAKLIVSTSGCFVVNFIWFFILGIRQNTFKEFRPRQQAGSTGLIRNIAWSGAAGTLWCLQFFFYGLGHLRMGNFQFTGWAIHMSMLIFFSYIVGLIMKEWKMVSGRTYALLITGLLVLCFSFILMTLGSMK